ncbi:toxin-antitoxin system YwqK family antitoxin [Enterococcus sp. LJL128]
MNNEDYDFLSKESTLKHGINFDEELAYGGEHDLEIVSFDQEDNEIIFTGLTYDLFDNGNIDMYMTVENGLKQGPLVEFYPNGHVKSINNMDKNVSDGEQVEFYEDGKIKRVEERKGGFLMTFVEYNQEGKIIDEKKEPTDFDKMMARKFG